MTRVSHRRVSAIIPVLLLLTLTLVSTYKVNPAHAALPPPVNLIANPSFENGVHTVTHFGNESGGLVQRNYTVPVDWDFETCEGVADANVTLDSTTATDGNHSARVYTGPITNTYCANFLGSRNVGFTQLRAFITTPTPVNFTDLTDSPDGFSFWFKLQPYNTTNGMAGFDIRVFGAESIAELDYAINPDPSLNFANNTGVTSFLFYNYQPGQWYHFSRNLRADWMSRGLSLKWPLSLIMFEGLAEQPNPTTTKSETFWLDDVRVLMGPPAFSISANPGTLVVSAVSPPTFSSITLASIGGFAGTVNLTAWTQGPGGLFVKFGSSGGSFCCSTTAVTLTSNGQNSTSLYPVLGGASPGSYLVTVVATSGPISHQITVTIIVTGSDVAGWASSLPSIDGKLSPGEWAPAATIPFNITYSTGIDHGTLYIMNDNANLYLAIKIHDSTFDRGDNLDLFFDNNNTGVQTSGDAVFQFDVNSLDTTGNGFFDSFWNSSFGPTGRLEDRAVGGTADGFGAASGDGNYNYFEISHPLYSTDTRHDFSLKPGDSFGLLIGYTDDGMIGSYWPSPDAIPYYPLRAQITLATASMPDFYISAAPSNLAIPLSPPAHTYDNATQVFLGSINNFQGNVSLSSTVNSTGLVAQLQSGLLLVQPGSQGVTRLQLNASRIGLYDVTITGTYGPKLNHSVDVYVNVTRMTIGDFTLKVTPGGTTLGPGTNSTATISLTAVDNFTGVVQLKVYVFGHCHGCSGLNDPFGPQAFANPSAVFLPINGTGSSTLKIEASTLERGTFTVEVFATSGFLLPHVFNFTLYVPRPDFAITPSTATIISIAAGGSSSLTFTLASVYGFSGVVSLSSSSTLTSFNAQGVTLSNGQTETVTLKINTTTATTPGNYVIIVTATAFSGSHNATIQLAVTSGLNPSVSKTTILGFDPPVFYAIVGVVAAGVAALGGWILFFQRKTRIQKGATPQTMSTPTV